MCKETNAQIAFNMVEEHIEVVKSRSFRLYPKEYKRKMLVFRESRLKEAERNIKFFREKMEAYEREGKDEIAFIALAMLERERNLQYYLENVYKTYNEMLGVE